MFNKKILVGKFLLQKCADLDLQLIRNCTPNSSYVSEIVTLMAGSVYFVT